MVKKFSDIISAIAFLVFSVIMFIASLNIKKLTIVRIGSDFFPKLVAVLIFISSIVLLINSIRVLNITKVEDLNFLKYKRTFITVAMMFAYILLLDKIGFLILTVIYLFVHFIMFSQSIKSKIALYMILSVVLSGSIYYLFNNILNLLLPSGIFL